MAEAIFSHKIKEANAQNLISCNSVGTAGYHIGAQPDNRTLSVLRNHGIDFNHNAQKLEASDLSYYDKIIAMDSSNLEDIIYLASSEDLVSKAELMREYDEISPGDSVPDPYYGGMEDFNDVYVILERSCEKLLQTILNKAT